MHKNMEKHNKKNKSKRKSADKTLSDSTSNQHKKVVTEKETTFKGQYSL